MNKTGLLLCLLALMLTSMSAQARFTQMDTWEGIQSQPITLNKYTYANVDPVSYVDPTGNFGLASFGTAQNIRAQLGTQSVRSFGSSITRAIGSTLQTSGRAVTKNALRTLRQCIRKKNQCGLQFNLLIVGYDNKSVRDNIRNAQTASTVVLTYQRNKPGNRRWYATGGGRGGCRQPPPKPIGYQCDEYPFFKTVEGGPPLKPYTSLKWVPARENVVVGGHFGFLARNMVSRDEFVVITSDSLPTVALPLSRKKK